MRMRKVNILLCCHMSLWGRRDSSFHFEVNNYAKSNLTFVSSKEFSRDSNMAQIRRKQTKANTCSTIRERILKITIALERSPSSKS